jgi:hypothetical protein
MEKVREASPLHASDFATAWRWIWSSKIQAYYLLPTAHLIDEYRRDFLRVPWGGSKTVPDGSIENVTRFRQVWFAGNHSDIGGSYPENESRLSDITLEWMKTFISKELPDEATRIIVNDDLLRPYPSSAGMMHDELMVGHARCDCMFLHE